MPVLQLSEPLVVPGQSTSAVLNLTDALAIPGQGIIIELTGALLVDFTAPEDTRTSPEFFLAQEPGWGTIEFDNEETWDLIQEQGLDTTLFLALFTDARAEDTDPLPNTDNDRRGWWGDELLGIKTGSKMWLTTERGKLTDESIREAEDAMREAIQRQLIDPGMIDDVTIESQKEPNGVKWEIGLLRKASDDIYLSYSSLWEGQNAKEVN